MDSKQIEATKRFIGLARNQRQLVDVSEEARQDGFACKCEVGVPLWHSLFWKYPSAGKKDVLAIGDILEVLHNRLQRPFTPRKSWHHIRPPQPTWWMGPQYKLRLMVFYRRHRVESVVIMSELDKVWSLFPRVPLPLPASLLVRLIQTMRELSPICDATERPLIRSLNTTIYELFRKSPLSVEINEYLDLSYSCFVPSGFSRQEYREVTFRSLWEQLELVAAVADKAGADINLPVSGVMQLLANFVGLQRHEATGGFPHCKAPLH